MTATPAWAATAPESGLAPLSIDRRDLRDEDVAIDIAFCGVCHSDLTIQTNRNPWWFLRFSGSFWSQGLV